jgi:hypothetical protein
MPNNCITRFREKLLTLLEPSLPTDEESNALEPEYYCATDVDPWPARHRKAIRRSYHNGVGYLVVSRE